MKLHKREAIYRKAELDFNIFYVEWVKKHHLTDGEILMILASSISTIAKYQIRYERHGNYNEPGGLE